MKVLTENSINRNILVYGPAGSGKSYALHTIRKPVLIIQTEPGYVSALDVPEFKERVRQGDAVVALVESWDDLQYLRFGVDEFCKAHKLDTGNFKAVALDSITWASELAKDDIMKKYPTKTGLPEIQQWQVITEHVKQIVRALLRFKGLAVVIAQADARDVEEPGGTATLWVPGMPGRYATRIAHDFDWVVFTRRTLSGQFIAETAGGPNRIAKVRGREVPPSLPLDFAEIEKVLAGEA